MVHVLTQAEVTGCHWDQGVRLSPPGGRPNSLLSHALGMRSLSGFSWYLTLFCETLQFLGQCLMVEPFREVYCCTSSLICVVKLTEVQSFVDVTMT